MAVCANQNIKLERYYVYKLQTKPNQTNNELSISDVEKYMKYDIVDFVLLMIIGRTAGTRIKGAEDAIKDGSLWGNLCEEYGYDLVRIVLEELHELMSSHKQNPERKQ